MKELQIFLSQDFQINLLWESTEEEYSEKEQDLQKDLFTEYSKNYDAFLFHIGITDASINLPVGLTYIRKISSIIILRLSKIENLEILRENASLELDDDTIDEILFDSPFIPGIEFLNRDFIRLFCNKINNEYQDRIKKYSGTVEELFKSFNPDMHIAGRVYFHLVENKNEETPFAFLATYTKESRHIPLKNALIEFDKDNNKLLSLISTIYTAAKDSKIIKEFLDNGEIFHPLNLTAEEALTILKEIPLYEKSGIICRIPNWWKYRSRSARLNIKIGEKQPGFVGMDSIMDFNAEILLGDEKLSISQVNDLINKTDGLEFIKGKWVEVDKEKLSETLKAYENALELAEDGLSLKDAMKLQFQPDAVLHHEGNGVQISNGLWLEELISKLRNNEKCESVNVQSEFKATLRNYQKTGLNWLYLMNTIGFGCCLADDMGLGKTIQILALLSVLKKNKKCFHLLVIPASLIVNWVLELNKFAPYLKYLIAHSSYNKINDISLDEENLNKYDLVITTYSFLVRNEDISNVIWDSVILDEAQNIKNPGTKQTKTVKKLKAKNKIVMTGTPIENRLLDLWSLFDFINPGLLGNQKEFSVFLKSLREDQHGYSRLKKIISPFILRRLKTDKSIITDLPDKVEINCYADLTKKQIVIYEKQVNELMNRLHKTIDGIEKKGLVLSSLMKFKQLCNHPDQFFGQDSYLEEDSGKFIRLREICEIIHEKREKVLVFSQFAEIADHLSKYLGSIFHNEGLVLHGGIPVKKRKEIIERFQSKEYIPFMILSLKAGGVGLNLTEANHVIHFDRWWNPAVENQATDRAFRIGQKKNVMVHKFITRGTIEEKIDKMIESKKALSSEIIGDAGEKWITEFDNEQLKELFSLSI